MNEVRQDPTSGTVTIYAPERSCRPRELPIPTSERSPEPEYRPTCPFCPGNEAQLAGIIVDTKDQDGAGWRTRVVANRYPALSPEVRTCTARRGTGEQRNSSGRGLFETLSAYGHHEVVIESPRHNSDLAEVPPSGEAGSVIETYHARYLALMSDPRIQTINIFRNRGVAAGATLTHPHSQIIAMPLIPPEIERRQNIMERYAEAHGRCLYCDIVDSERLEGRRVIRETREFIAFVPYAAVTPFEVWIVPKRHQEGFDLIEPEEKSALAVLLHDMLRRLGDSQDDPDYNLMLVSRANRGDTTNGGHWYLSIRPRLITLGGFEIGAGMNINPSLPERDAELLRDQT